MFTRLFNSSFKSWFYYSITVLIAFALLFDSLFYPFVRDQSIFGYIGNTIIDGGMPYVDVWEIKPPGVYALFALFASLSDEIYSYMKIVHLGDVIFAIATSIFLARLTKRFELDEAGIGAALWYAAFYYTAGYKAFSQAEAWTNPLIVGSAITCLYAINPSNTFVDKNGLTKRWFYFFLIGILTGTVFIFKYISVIIVAPFLLYALWITRDRFKLCLLFLSGVILVLALTFCWMYFKNAWVAFVDIQQTFLAPYVSSIRSGPKERISAFIRGFSLFNQHFWIPLLLSLAALLFLKNGRHKIVWLSIGTLLTSFLSIVIQNKYFNYQWMAVFPWLALTAALGTTALLNYFKLNRTVVLYLVFFIPLIWIAQKRGIKDHVDGVLYATNNLSKHDWFERFKITESYNFLESDSVVTYIVNNSESTDPILIWGFEPIIYLLADRSSPSRFMVNIPLRMKDANQNWRNEFMNDLVQKPPAIVAVAANDNVSIFGVNGNSIGDLESWKQFYEWLQTNYTKETFTGKFQLYKRKR